MDKISISSSLKKLYKISVISIINKILEKYNNDNKIIDVNVDYLEDRQYLGMEKIPVFNVRLETINKVPGYGVLSITELLVNETKYIIMGMFYIQCQLTINDEPYASVTLTPPNANKKEESIETLIDVLTIFGK